MKVDKKLSIKVKSRAKELTSENPEVEQVTEWNIQRIIFALIALMFLLTLFIFYFSAQDEGIQKIEKKITQIEPEILPLDSIKTPDIKINTDLVSSQEPKEPLVNKVLEKAGRDITTNRTLGKQTLKTPDIKINTDLASSQELKESLVNKVLEKAGRDITTDRTLGKQVLKTPDIKNNTALASSQELKESLVNKVLEKAGRDITTDRTLGKQVLKTPDIQNNTALASSQELKEPLVNKVFEKAGIDITADRVLKKQILSKPVEAEKYLSKNILRAQLVKGFNKSGPYGKPDLPVLVNKTEAEGLFFFTEVKNMHGRTVFHEWLKEGKIVYKYKFIMRSNKGEMYTSKLFTDSSVGTWQVRIITSKDEVLHKVDFSVQRQ